MNIVRVVGEGKLGKAQSIFSLAFDPCKMRIKRSTAYLEGAYASLCNAASAGDTNFVMNVCPYSPGECAFDAWFAGSEEGRRLWRINKDEHGEDLD